MCLNSIEVKLLNLLRNGEEARERKRNEGEGKREGGGKREWEKEREREYVQESANSPSRPCSKEAPLL